MTQPHVQCRSLAYRPVSALILPAIISHSSLFFFHFFYFLNSYVRHNASPLRLFCFGCYNYCLLGKMWLCVPSFCRSSWMERNKGNLPVNCSPLIECDFGISGSQPAPLLSLQGHCCSHAHVTFTHISPTLNFRFFFDPDTNALWRL